MGLCNQPRIKKKKERKKVYHAKKASLQVSLKETFKRNKQPTSPEVNKKNNQSINLSKSSCKNPKEINE